jgi:hypothetical protein
MPYPRLLHQGQLEGPGRTARRGTSSVIIVGAGVVWSRAGTLAVALVSTLFVYSIPAGIFHNPGPNPFPPPGAANPRC